MPFFEFSLCLSRACLGKIMHFIYKWLKNGRFPYRVVEEARRAVVVALFAAAEIMPAENPFPSTFPTFVPSLSW